MTSTSAAASLHAAKLTLALTGLASKFRPPPTLLNGITGPKCVIRCGGHIYKCHVHHGYQSMLVGAQLAFLQHVVPCSRDVVELKRQFVYFRGYAQPIQMSHLHRGVGREKCYSIDE